MEVDSEEQTAREAKAKALKEKELGNAAYKAKDFSKAIQHYDAAIQLDDSDISFLTNRSPLPPPPSKAI
jgi:stress-induced-phosphoprotein 1